MQQQLEALKIVPETYEVYVKLVEGFTPIPLRDINQHFLVRNKLTGKFGWVTPEDFPERYVYVGQPTFDNPWQDIKTIPQFED